MKQSIKVIFRKITHEEKQKLGEQTEGRIQLLSRKDVKHRGSKIFRKLDSKNGSNCELFNCF